MDKGFDIDYSNVDILEEFFTELSDINQRGIFMSAYRKAAVPLIARIKANVAATATDRGNLWRSIGTRAVQGESDIWMGSILATKYVTKRGKLSNVWYGRLTEGGASNVGRRPKGMSRRSMKDSGRGGVIAAKHWFSNAWEAEKDNVYNSINKEWYDAINRLIVRTNRKQNNGKQ